MTMCETRHLAEALDIRRSKVPSYVAEGLIPASVDARGYGRCNGRQFSVADVAIGDVVMEYHGVWPITVRQGIQRLLSRYSRRGGDLSRARLVLALPTRRSMDVCGRIATSQRDVDRAVRAVRARGGAAAIIDVAAHYRRVVSRLAEVAS